MALRGDRAVSWRWKIRRIRHRARRLRKWLLVTAGALAAALSTAYEDVPVGLRWPAVLVVALLSFGAMLLTVGSGGDVTRPAVSGRFERRRASHGPPTTGQRRRSSATARVAQPRSDRREPRRPRRWLPWPRQTMAPTLPPGDGLFRGRDRELHELLTRHDEQRAARDGRGRGTRLGNGRPRPDHRSTVAGPVLLLIHGKAGVGKSTLADELARRLAPHYPHGQIFANLGTAGAARTPKEVLKDFLLALGWSEDEMPQSTVERARIFRSLTRGKRMLFILDAARHADQVRHVIPSSPTVAVIITSRRDLSIDPYLNPGTRSYRLDVLDPDEAEEMFRAVAGLPPGSRPIQVHEVVKFCGGLPAAIRSAAEWVSQDGTDVGHVAGLLRPADTRLRWLDRPGRPVSSLIEGEYNRLLPEEQQAFAVLGLVPSATFVPWVLSPLLAVPQAQAEALIDRLSAVQLVDNLGRDDASGLARYRFHDLTGLLARQKAAALPPALRAEALARLDEAYLEVVASVLTRVDPDYPQPPPGRWFDDPELSEQLALKPGPWVRHDYPMLLRVIAAAARRGDHSLCWRVGAWLDGCVPAVGEVKATRVAYDTALTAAEKAGDQLGRVDVMLAKGAFLAGIERYNEAIECLRQAVEEATELGAAAGPDARPAALRRLLGHLKLGEAFRQAALYGHADEELKRAAALRELASEGETLADLWLLATEIHQVESPDLVYDPLLDGRPNSRRYRLLLSLAEAARRRGDWESCAEHLTEALGLAEGDARRTASVSYRMARAALEQALNGSEADQGLEFTAVRRAAAAVVALEAMDNPAGTVRARCLLARALAAAGLATEAEQMVHETERRMEAVKELASEAHPALAARLEWAKGEVLLMSGDVAVGRRTLIETATWLGEQRDWTGHAVIMRRLELFDQLPRTGVA